LSTASSSPEAARGTHSLGAHLRRKIAQVSRWLHLYLSMFSFVVILFFAATGLTLNHAEWFSQREVTTRHAGTIAQVLLRPAGQSDSDKLNPDKLGIAEFLRKTYKLQGTVSDFRVEDTEISISLRGPGYAADAFIELPGGHYELTETRNGLVAVMNDLHKGRDTGKAWSVVIDASAILLVLVSVTGLLLILFLHKRRASGLLLAFAGGILCWLLFRIFVS
jgi:hypothetical protein